MKTSSKIEKALAVAMETCGGTTLSAAAAAIFSADLSRYPEAVVLAALERCRREVTGRLSLAHIVKRIEQADGRPTADEAWAIVGTMDEGRTLVATSEALSALADVCDLLEGDPTGARMAFRARYDTIVEEARAQGTPVRWIASLGHDPAGRRPVLQAAVEAGRLDAAHVCRLLGIKSLSAPALPPSPIVAQLATGKALPDRDEVRAHVDTLKAITDLEAGE